MRSFDPKQQAGTMKILESTQIRALDAHTIASEPISSINLMERAAQAFVRCFCDQFVQTRPVAVFCGKGNNGGDGLAIARLLTGRSFKVKVYVVEYSPEGSADFTHNLTRLEGYLTPTFIRSHEEIPPMGKDEVVIDALLGSGLSRPVTGLLADVIACINKTPNKTISVDIASGLYMDTANASTDVIIEPDCTISFQLPKLAFMMPGNLKFTGDWHMVEIGLDTSFLDRTPTVHFYTDKKAAEALVRPRGRFSHKGTFGHALLIAGSYGKMGAALLAGKACLRSGVGLLTMLVPECGYTIAQISVPEAMVLVDKKPRYITEVPPLGIYSAVGIGPGLDKEPLTARMLENLLTTVQAPLVVDADALNLIAENDELRRKLPENTILTPHPKEFERLAGKSANEFERLTLAKNYAKDHQLIICLKGAHSAVILPNGEVHFNSTGNPGMSTGGTGDVLTGVITALLAQGYPPAEAAILGAYQHGLAGDKAAEKKGQNALIASDVVDCLRW
jgi:hydroxyethylthiazole kinase-like uncharacterized protein yjeF